MGERMLKIGRQVRTVDDQAADLGSMIRAIRRKKLGEGLYCVVYNGQAGEMMEVQPLAMLLADSKRCDYTVLGVAKGKPAALEVVRLLVEKMAQDGGTFNVKEHFA